MAEFKIDEEAPILVELTPYVDLSQIEIQTIKPAPEMATFRGKPGLVKSTGLAPDLIEKSARALDSAMNTIHHMARRVKSTIENLIDPPSEVEVAFGLKLEGEAGAIIAKAGAQATLDVKLKWQNKKGHDAQG